MVAGSKFGYEAGNKMLARKAVYVLNISGAVLRAFLAETMDEIGYMPSYSNPDLWLRPAVKPDGFEYYKYIICYVDGMLCTYHNPCKLIKIIQEHFKPKYYKIEPPDVYIGAKIAKMKLESGEYCWTIFPEQYVKAAVKNVVEDLARSGKRLPPKCVTPISTNYAPWLEDSPELMAYGVQQYQELIGLLRWAAEIGRLNIPLEMSLLSRYLAMPQIGHLDQ